MVALPALAIAQDEGDGASTTADAEATETSSDEETPAPSQAGGSSTSGFGYSLEDRPFEPRRGFFTEGEFGIFTTLGGRNTSLPNIPDEPISNVSPYIGITIGYDVFSNESFALSIGPKFGVAFNDGSSRLSEADVQAGADGTTFVNDWAAYEAGLSMSVMFMAMRWLSVTTKLNGGVVFVDANPNVDFCGFNADNPNPGPRPEPGSDPADRERFRQQCGNTDAGDLSIGGMFGASLGVDFYTLLTGFSVGLQVRFQGLLVDGFIPSLAIVPLSLRYNF